MKKLSLVFSLLAVFAISTMNAQAPVCKMEAGKCVITNADGTTTVVDAKDCAVKCTTGKTASTECAKKCTATKAVSSTGTCTKKSATTKTVSTTTKATKAQTVNFLPEAKTEKKCSSAKSACCAKDAKKKAGTK